MKQTTNVQAYKHVSRGNADEAISKAAHVISHHFETPWTEHAFLEPECAVAYIDDDGDVMIISTDQSAYCTFHESSPNAWHRQGEVSECPCGRWFWRQGRYDSSASCVH